MTYYTAIIRRDGARWYGWIGEINGVNAQARTRAGLLDDLESALGERLSLEPASSRPSVDPSHRLMIPIAFPDVESKRRALGALPGRYPFRSHATGLMLVPDEALSFLTDRGIEFRDAVTHLDSSDES